MVEISLTVSPIKNAEGTIIGISKIARDITERRRAQEQQNLLLREMSHRVKNLFAVTGRLVTLSARGGPGQAGRPRPRPRAHTTWPYELATNAAKYGALSSPGGYIRIDWSVENDELLANWKEHSGPSLDGPAEREGFGGSLVRRLVTGQFGGRLSYDWKPKGLIIRLSLPVERLTM